MTLAVVGSTTAEVFEVYFEKVLAPSLRRGQLVVMDNLSSHRGKKRVRELIEASGCELVYLPPYSPISIPSRKPSARLRTSSEKPKPGPARL